MINIKVRYDLGYTIELLDAVLVNENVAVLKDGQQLSVVTVKPSEVFGVYDDAGAWGFVIKEITEFSDAVTHLNGMTAVEFITSFSMRKEYELV